MSALIDTNFYFSCFLETLRQHNGCIIFPVTQTGNSLNKAQDYARVLQPKQPLEVISFLT